MTREENHAERHGTGTCDSWHTCHFCGTQSCEEGYEVNGKRHWLSDCRPDLVKHEIGSTCTWAYRRESLYNAITGAYIESLPENRTCYAYQNDKNEWTDEHKYFYPDGPV